MRFLRKYLTDQAADRGGRATLPDRDSVAPVVGPGPAPDRDANSRILALGTRRLMGIAAPRQLDLTGGPVRVTAVGAQELRLALDVLRYDVLDLELRVLRLEGTSSPDVTIELQTGMSINDPLSWVSDGAFTLVSTSDSAEVKRFENMLRYVRWNVSALRGTNPAAVFQIRGIARRWS